MLGAADHRDSIIEKPQYHRAVMSKRRRNIRKRKREKVRRTLRMSNLSGREGEAWRKRNQNYWLTRREKLCWKRTERGEKMCRMERHKVHRAKKWNQYGVGPSTCRLNKDKGKKNVYKT